MGSNSAKKKIISNSNMLMINMAGCNIRIRDKESLKMRCPTRRYREIKHLAERVFKVREDFGLNLVLVDCNKTISKVEVAGIVI